MEKLHYIALVLLRSSKQAAGWYQCPTSLKFIVKLLSKYMTENMFTNILILSFAQNSQMSM